MAENETVNESDSSDEEDIAFEVVARIKNFKDDEIQNVKNFELSFISHAIGIKLLYCPSVQSRYKELKQAFLNEEPLIYKSNDTFIKDLEESYTKAMGNVNIHFYDEDKKEDLLKSILSIITRDRNEYACNYLKYILNNGDNVYDGPKSYQVLIKEIFIENEKYQNFSNDRFKNFINNFDLPFPYEHRIKEHTFDLSTTTSDNFVIEFLSHLRLHNRQEKKQIKHREFCTNSEWKIFELNPIKLENKDEFNKKYSRNEQIYLEGDKEAPYSKFFQDSVFNSKLVEKRINIKFENANVENSPKFPLWYLLFGCEVIRNPASLVHNNMFLDLMNKGNIQESLIPMSRKGIIKNSNGLNLAYSKFMPHEYYYQTAFSGSPKILVEREVDITIKWLQFKLGITAADALIQQLEINADKDNAIREIWKCIWGELSVWKLNIV